MRIFFIALLLSFSLNFSALAEPQAERKQIVQFSPVDGFFPLAQNGNPVSLLMAGDDLPGVLRAFTDFQKDLERVTGVSPDLLRNVDQVQDRVVIAGTFGSNPVIDELHNSGRLDLSYLEGKWETFHIEVVQNPVDGIEEALVIVGSDRRGTIFGIYEMSRQIGVSPWYWWADVPVIQQSDLYVAPDAHTLGEPGVEYRGIFINNENPALLGFVQKNFGWFTHEFYEHVFELILRNQANYLWPAMWGKAFHDNDELNPKMADEYGIVIGYSHHEPMMRSHIEWSWYGEGPWDYSQNEDVLREFWREGIERIKDYETTVTLGMRGDGDEPLSDDRNIELLERIVADQREIIQETAQDTSKILQYWALYKEVQEYYEMGMEVPEDVMIFLANDNWGNIRMLPDPETAAKREGGWGMYYHFDYVGGPRNYKWINTIQISRIWEQMGLAWEHDVNRIWLVNVGDIKPMEFPISFFLDYAWNPDMMPVEEMNDYPAKWAASQFGDEFSEEIGYLLTEYTRINSRRKPELLDENTYRLHHFREAERVQKEWSELLALTAKVKEGLPEIYHDAFYQLVEFKVLAASNLQDLYVATAKNHWYGNQIRNTTNQMAEEVRHLFDRAQEITDHYNYGISDGKWQHMMDQTHIGYTYWQQPPANRMPYVDIIQTPHNHGVMAISVEGNSNPWPGPFDWPGPTEDDEPRLPTFDRYHQQEFFFEIFNQGEEEFEYEIEAGAPWIQLSSTSGTIATQDTIWVSIDWNNVSHGTRQAPIFVTGPAESGEHTLEILVDVFNPASPSPSELRGFVEQNGYISFEAENYSRNITGDEVSWKNIPQLGRTKSAMAPYPVVADVQEPGANSPRLEYDLHVFNPGEVIVRVYLSPTKNYSKNYRNLDGIRYALSFNNDDPLVVNMHDEMPEGGGFDTNVWYEWTRNNAIIKETTLNISEAGLNTLNFWLVDTGVVLQKIVIETKEIGETYLGPPQSFYAE